MQKLTSKELDKFLMWLNSNGKRDMEYNIVYKLSKQFLKATNGQHKNCKCKNKGYAVNKYFKWENWTCTYCLKPKQIDKNRFLVT